MINAHGGGHQQDADGHDAGNGGSIHTLGSKPLHIAPHRIAHGVVDAGAGDQGEDGNDQIGDGREFPDPGHHFGVDGSKDGAPEITHDGAAAESFRSEIDGPDQRTAQGADDHAQVMNVKENGETDAADKT